MLLALDTATMVSSVALAGADKLVAELTLHTDKHHSEQLMPHIADIFRLANVAKSELKGIAVSIGPGSFTGLRIGLATAKALAYALAVPIIGVPTLAALAYGCLAPGTVISPLLDAQKGNVYQGLYAWDDGQLQQINSPRVVSLATALTDLTQYDVPAIVLGEAAVMYAAEIKQVKQNILLAPPHLIMPRAGNIALLGQHLLAQGSTDDVLSLEPLYIRRSEAEELWERRQQGCVRG